MRLMRAAWLAPARDTPSQAAETCVQTQARPVKRLAMGQLRRRRGLKLLKRNGATANCLKNLNNL
jgi:hypothetical protein